MTKERRKTVVLTPGAAQTIERVATDLELTHKAVTAAASQIASTAIVRELAPMLGEAKLAEARARVKAIEAAIGSPADAE